MIWLLDLYTCLISVVYLAPGIHYHSDNLSPITLDLMNVNENYIEIEDLNAPWSLKRYSLNEDYLDKFKIGNVIDGDKMIYENSPSLTLRLVDCAECGDKRVRIRSYYELRNGTEKCEVLDFILVDGLYKESIKKIVNLDLKKYPEYKPRNIKVSITPSTNTVSFGTSFKILQKYLIGKVKYGNIIFDNHIRDVIYKDVHIKDFNKDVFKVIIEVFFNNCNTITFEYKCIRIKLNDETNYTCDESEAVGINSNPSNIQTPFSINYPSTSTSDNNASTSNQFTQSTSSHNTNRLRSNIEDDDEEEEDKNQVNIDDNEKVTCTLVNKSIIDLL